MNQASPSEDFFNEYISLITLRRGNIHNNNDIYMEMWFNPKIYTKLWLIFRKKLFLSKTPD